MNSTTPTQGTPTQILELASGQRVRTRGDASHQPTAATGWMRVVTSTALSAQEQKQLVQSLRLPPVDRPLFRVELTAHDKASIRPQVEPAQIAQVPTNSRPNVRHRQDTPAEPARSPSSPSERTPRASAETSTTETKRVFISTQPFKKGDVLNVQKNEQQQWTAQREPAYVTLLGAVRQYQPLVVPSVKLNIVVVESHSASGQRADKSILLEWPPSAVRSSPDLLPPASALSPLSKSIPTLNILNALAGYGRHSAPMSQSQLTTNPVAPHVSSPSAPKNPPSIPALPRSILQSDQPLSQTSVRNAIEQSGHQLERTLLHGPLKASTQRPSGDQSLPTMQSGLQRVNHQIQQWMRELNTNLPPAQPKDAHRTPSSPTQTALGKPLSLVAAKVAAQIGASISFLQKSSALQHAKHPMGMNTSSLTEGSNAAPKTATPSNTQTSAQANVKNEGQTGTQTRIAPQDMKAWLAQTQLLLLQTLSSSTQGQSDSSKILDGLIRVLFPKVGGQQASEGAMKNDGLPLFSKKLSIQPQLFKVVQQLIVQQGKDTSDEGQQLRQLLNITQNLTRVQQEQVLNRHHQVQQPDQPDFQFSLPYLHDKHLHWCDIELAQREAGQETRELKEGWHLILRFAQNSNSAFAVEANLSGSKISISLWSESQDQLSRLHQHLELLREKLIRAGYQCETLNTKHGMPPKAHRQIQQSLVDVHT